MPASRALTVTHLYANKLDGKGGIERQAEYLLRTFNANGRISTHYRRTRFLAWGPLHPLSTIIAWVNVVWHALMDKPDVFHIHIAPRGSTVRKLIFVHTIKALGKPCILHLHGSAYDEHFNSLPPWRQRRTAEGFRAADRVVVLGETWKTFATQTLGVAPDRIAIIDNGAPSAPAANDPGASPPSIVFVGQLGDRKGVDVLIDACGQLTDIPWTLTLAGGGDIDRFTTQAQGYGIEDRITFAGWVTEAQVGELLHNAAIFTLPSRGENQPVAILEAMARGVPVVASTVGAIPEVVIDGETGALAPPGDPNALAGALRQLLKDTDKRRKMGHSGRELFERRFCIERTAEAFEDLYQSVARPPKLDTH